MEFLSEFNFVISYQSGKKTDKANALTCKPNKRIIDEKYKRLEHIMRVLLPPERFKLFIELQPIEIDNKNLCSLESCVRLNDT